MASGCTTSGSSASVLFQKLTPDTLVKYTGTPYPQFGICTNDLLSEVEAAILQQILAFSQGKGITLADIDLTTCDCFEEKVGCCGKESCQTLECILQAYLECLCALYEDVEDLKTTVGSMFDGPYTTKCLVGVTSASKLPAITQALINDLCTTQASLASLTTTVSTLSTGLPATIGTFLAAALSSCQTDAVKKTGSGSSFQMTFAGMLPIGSITMYGGPIAGVFDTTGLGISPGPACGWALCNGAVQNGIQTVDMRGYFPVGVNDGSMGGGAQNAEVNNSTYPGQSYSMNAHGGLIQVALTSGMCAVAPHSHTVTDPGHSHILRFGGDSFSGNSFSNMLKFDSNLMNSTLDGQADVGNIRVKILNNTTGISIGAVTGSGSSTGTPHENRPPYRGVYFIQRVA